MAYEVECVLRFERELGDTTRAEVEEQLDCIVIEWIPEEV